MNVSELCTLPTLTPVHLADGAPEIAGVYCCDLLSWAMSRAPEGCVWVTVMANINTLAVAALCDVAAIVLAEDAQIPDNVLQKAKEQGINLFASAEPIFTCAKAIDCAL